MKDPWFRYGAGTEKLTTCAGYAVSSLLYYSVFPSISLTMLASPSSKQEATTFLFCIITTYSHLLCYLFHARILDALSSYLTLSDVHAPLSSEEETIRKQRKAIDSSTCGED
nr:hypothetical protein CFP56_75431 [Quercus suber]